MGIWRQTTARKRPVSKGGHSLFENNDPFEHDDSFLGTFKTPASSVAAPVVKSGRFQKNIVPSHLNAYKSATRADVNDLLDADFSRISKMRTSKNILVYGMLALVLALTGFTLAKYRPWAMWGSQELVYAYFEVRAVDGAGRPVAGASVKNAGKKVGTTDSFGEWRRYMRVPLGSTVPITISKATAGEPLYAIKNFAVPPEKPEKSDMELRASVQLQSGAAGMIAAAAPAALVAKDTGALTSKNSGPVAEARDTLVASQPAVVAPPQKIVEEITVPTAAAAEGAAALQNDNVPSQFVSSHESIWFEVGTGASLQAAVLPALIQRAKEIGLKVDQRAPWRVRLNSLIEPPKTIGADGAGLIEISTSDQTNVVRQFLRNYQSDTRTTARGILYVLSHQVNKNVAVHQKDNRWIATLPKDSSELWRVAGGMSLSGSGREWLVGVEPYFDAKFHGFYLASLENPCGAGKTSCELKTRSFAETPAVPTWTRLKLRLMTTSKEKDSVKVFVSGYEAKSTSDNVLEYWGQDHAKANVTVTQNGKVIHRMQIVNDLRQPVNVAIGTASMSRR